MLEVIDKGSISDAHPVPLLFVHGAWHAAWCWDEHFLSFFADKGYRAVALNLRGHGNSPSDKPLRACSVADFVEDIASVADGLPTPPVIIGHSMGGHGAITLALRHPGIFRSVSAFAPICAPMRCPWGQKAFRNYLGEDQQSWRQHDATALIEDGMRAPDLLIDQGMDDQFLVSQLYPEALEKTCREASQKLTLRFHSGYDHGYYFISTFIGEHLKYHSEQLG